MKQIPLSRGLFAIVDDADYDAISAMRWHATKGKRCNTFYARHTPHGPHATRRMIYLHRFILGLNEAKRSVHIDHRNGDGLDNRRENLRVADAKQNGANRAGRKSRCYKGVSQHGLKWRARLGSGPGASHGLHATPEEAARAYDDAARKKYGEFARLNFPGPGEVGCTVHNGLHPLALNYERHSEQRTLRYVQPAGAA